MSVSGGGQEGLRRKADIASSETTAPGSSPSSAQPMEVSMSYIGEVRRGTFSSLSAAASGLLLAGLQGTVQFVKAVSNRRALAQLGEFDDRMLKDIGLSRSDLRDASAGPLWQDPTSVLVVRAVERRASRRRAVRDSLHTKTSTSESAKSGAQLVECS
jgi:uncharacterized protein YjiS (DUF1127 family)